jgi:hypothetical protein
MTTPNRFRFSGYIGEHFISTVDEMLSGKGVKSFKGYEVSTGYILRKVKGHPMANSRGYYAEHRLVVEASINRILTKDEVVHHKNGVRDDNRLDNLDVISQSKHAKDHLRGMRNTNGTFVAQEEIFNQIKYRLFDKDSGITRIYTLSKLIGTTFRRAKFEYRGRFTGLLDRNGKEIYCGDIVKKLNDDDLILWSERLEPLGEVLFENGCYVVGKKFKVTLGAIKCEIIGDIYTTPELLN